MYKSLVGNIRRAKDLGREEALKEVLEWLQEHTYSIHDRQKHCNFGINFESEEQMLQSFKERFNI